MQATRTVAVSQTLRSMRRAALRHALVRIGVNPRGGQVFGYAYHYLPGFIRYKALRPTLCKTALKIREEQDLLSPDTCRLIVERGGAPPCITAPQCPVIGVGRRLCADCS